MVEITDKDSARAWLETQPKEVCVAMAARAALRGVAGVGGADRRVRGDIALTVLRAILTAGAAGTCPAPADSDLESAAAYSARSALVAAGLSSARSAAHYSADSARAAASSAADSARAAADSARSSAIAAAAAAVDDRSSGPDAVSTAGSARSSAADSAYYAFKMDADGVAAAESLDLLFRHRVWQNFEEPEGLAKARAALLQFLDADPAKWDFWARWYRGMFDGRPMDWALQRAVALIPDDVWQAGPEAVAARIAEIEAEFVPMPPEAAREQAQVLLLRPQITVLQANGLRELIDRAVDEYRREVCNQLPDCLQPLENLPVILHQIAETTGGVAPMTEKEAALMRLLPMMAGTISDLNRRLEAAHAEKATGDPDKRRLFHDAFYGRLGERGAELITSKTLWGVLLLGTSVFLGSSVENVQAGLSTCYENIIRPEAAPERWPPPPPQFDDPLDEV